MHVWYWRISRRKNKKEIHSKVELNKIIEIKCDFKIYWGDKF